MPLNRRLILPFVLATICAAEARATTCSAGSGATSALLVELYTSEGCNSCPPADRWLSRLRQEKSESVVALAFHVDYWDYLGWKDRFANPEFSRRQREAGVRNGLATIYTPQVLVNGRDFTSWRRHSVLAGVAGGGLPARADLRLSWSAAARELVLEADARLRDGRSGSAAAAYLAIVENALSSDVRAGENRGERLTHDFVVRELLGPYAFDGKGTLQLRRTLAMHPDWKTPDLALALFVQNRGSGEVLQALMVPNCDPSR
jgi:hypothetical protein